MASSFYRNPPTTLAPEWPSWTPPGDNMAPHPRPPERNRESHTALAPTVLPLLALFPLPRTCPRDPPGAPAILDATTPPLVPPLGPWAPWGPTGPP